MTTEPTPGDSIEKIVADLKAAALPDPNDERDIDIAWLRQKMYDACDRLAVLSASARACTCHPDDNPPRPCPQKFALSECRASARASEPVAWRTRDVWGWAFTDSCDVASSWRADHRQTEPLYAAPPTDAAVVDLRKQLDEARKAETKAWEGCADLGNALERVKDALEQQLAYTAQLETTLRVIGLYVGDGDELNADALRSIIAHLGKKARDALANAAMSAATKGGES